MHPLARLDHLYLWHPFTQMRDWLRREPLVMAKGSGAVLGDAQGRKYLDANSSIWTNLHGHNHPAINAALSRQLKKIAHSSALGLANEPASRLAEQLVKAANAPVGQASCLPAGRRPAPPYGRLKTGIRKVFFSDDGSTAIEVALKLAYEFARRTGHSAKPKFLSLRGAYHGDSVGAVALGHIELFHRAYKGLLFKTDQVMAPYCYRCPFNRAAPERADAREYRKCGWECLDKFERKFEAQRKQGNPYAAFVFEPLIQGAAGMIPQPSGWLRQAAQIARGHGALLIADEVMTGFGRTGSPAGASGLPARAASAAAAPSLFACHHEGVQPDFLVLAKGLTGGYLPMAATLTTQAVFDTFLGEYGEFKTFFHGHSFTGNQLGAAAALASLKLLEGAQSIRARSQLEQTLRQELRALWNLPNVGDIRQAGLVAGIELVKDWRTREPFDLREGAGVRVCEAMAKRGVLTRPVGNVIVLMPPYCTTPGQARRMVAALSEGVREMQKALNRRS
ncbi:MAG TPA: aminotransferase class III-fold pyridoxal phosphate-dependent enzyme [Dongiaceae bacterium]|nr:aminotransferase class III-fold pyridoxal phosphate-dependent enzyme [Dongiaceae bacterium]